MTETEAAETAKSASVWTLLRNWRYFFWLLGLGLLVMLFYAEENWRGRWAWAKYKRTQEAAGERLHADAFVPPPVDDSENFAMTPLLASLFDFVPGTHQMRDTNAVGTIRALAGRYDAAARELKKHPGSNSWITHRNDLAVWHAAFLNTPADGGIGIRVSSTNLIDERAAKGLLEALAECAPHLEELRAASHRPRSRFNLDYDLENPAGILLPHLSFLKQLSQILSLRASAKLALGDTDAAFEDVELMLFLANAAREEPFMITHVVRLAQAQLALRPVAQGMKQWSDAQLLALESQLQQFNFLADGKRALRAERSFLGGGVIDLLRRSPGQYAALASSSAIGPVGPDFPTVALSVAPKGWFELEKLNHHRFVTEHLLPIFDEQNMRVSPGAAGQASESITALSGKSSLVLLLEHRFVLGLLLPDPSGMARRCAFGQSGLQCAAVACALERYRRAHNEFPASLQQLTPQFVAKVPHDLISGAPLKYHRTADGQYILYSVGWNETDDDARIGRTKTSETDDREGDWGWTP